MHSERALNLLYKYRWALSALVLVVIFGSLGVGWKKVEKFTKQVDSLADSPPEKSEPRFLDLRTDIWFDTKDPALKAYRELETKYVGEDAVIIAFEDKDDPYGVFGVKALTTIAALTKQLESVRYVRAVRSLTANPWIRWGMVGSDPADREPGLVVSDLFENAPASYTDGERLERMVAIIGAANAAKLVGEKTVRARIGSNANFADHIGEPRLLKNIVSENGRATTLLVQVLRPRISEERLEEVFGSDKDLQRTGLEIHIAVAQAEALAGIKKVLAEAEGYKFRLAGSPVMQDHFQQTAAKDLAFMGAMFLVIALILLVIYRRAAGVLLPLMVVFVAIAGMMGIVLLKGDLINTMTASTPIILIAIGVADAVHLVTAYYLLRPRYTDKRELIIAVVKHNAMPVFLTSATTAVGFLSLMTSGINPTRAFGYTVAIGTMLAFVVSMTLVPAILSLFKLRAKTGHEPVDKEPEPGSVWTDRLTGFVMRRRTTIVVVGVLVTILSGIGFTKVDIQADMRLMFGADDPQVVDLVWLNDNIGGTGDLEILFDGDTAIAQDAKFLGQLDKFQARLEQESLDQKSPLRILANFDSPLGVLRKIHQVRNENKASFYRVPTEEDIPADARKPRVLRDEVTDEEIVIPAQTASTMVAQYYLQFESGAKPTDNLSTLMTPDRKSMRVTVRTRMAPTGTTLAAYARIRHIAKTEFPELAARMRLTGNYFMQMNMTEAFADTVISSLTIALIVITLLIMLVFRSPIIGLLSIVPNILPIMIPFGLFALFGIALDGPAVMVATVGLGVCVDDTIHFLTKYTRARNAGLPAEEAVRVSFRQVGAALTYTTIVLVGGFAMMGFASFRPNAMVGYLGATMIALAWVADFVLTPAVISFLPDKKPPAKSA